MRKKNSKLILWMIVFFIISALGWVVVNKSLPRRQSYYQIARDKEIEELARYHGTLNQKLQALQNEKNQIDDEQERNSIEFEIRYAESEIRDVERQITQLQRWNLYVLSDDRVMSSESIFIKNSKHQLIASLFFPPEIRFGDSSIIDLTIRTFVNEYNSWDPLLNNPTHILDIDESLLLTQIGGEEKIKLIMQADLKGVGFSIAGMDKTQEIVSDRQTTWSWTVKPLDEGQQDLFVDITVPMKDGSIRRVVLHSIQIEARKSFTILFRDVLPYIISGSLGLVGVIIGIIADRKRNKK
jgi:hypothetical protein